MQAILDKTILFVEPMALAVLLVYAYGFFSRSNRPPHVVNLIMGAVFGLAAAAAMQAPIPIADGIIIDVRNLFIGVAAAYFGLIGASVSLLIGVSTRVIVGGDGVALGILGMVIASVMGLIWAQYVRPRIRHDLLAFVVLGAMISAHMAAALFLAPAIRHTFFFGLGPTLLTANLVGAVLLSFLIRREYALKAETDHLTSATMTDSLTGLMNRDAAVRAYDMMPDSVDPTRGVSMLCIDVDGFKQINDTHGHLRGDDVLVEIAERMTACLRPEDIFARMSGDEFVIVLADLTKDDADRVANRCLTSVSQYPVHADGADISVSVSIGGTWMREKPGFAALRDLADQALYDAKGKGRDRVVLAKAKAAPRMGLQAAVA